MSRGSPDDDKFKILFESAPDAIYLCDNKGNFVDGNIAAEKLTGYKRKELIGKSFLKLKLLPKAQIPKAAKKLAENARGKPTGPDEYTLNCKDGTQVTVEIRTFPIKVEGKNLLLGIARDITERKEVGEALKESEERLKLLIESAEDIIVMQDRDGKYLYYNAPPNYGLLPEEVVGKTPSEIHVPEVAAKITERVKKVVESRESVTEEEEMTWEEKTIYFNVLVSPIKDADGNVTSVTTILRNITVHKEAEEALKSSEERHSALINSSRYAIMTLEPPTWKFTSGNPATISLFGVKDENDFTSRPPWEYSPEYQPDGKPSLTKAKAMIKKAMDTGSNYFEWTHKKITGEEFPATVLLSRTQTENKTFLQATVMDITDRKEAEEELKKAYEELKTLDEVKVNVVSNVTHELRTPITIMRGAMELLQEEESPDKMNELLDVAINALMRQDRVVGDLIEASKMSEREKIKLKPVDMKKILNRVVAEFGLLLEKDEIKVKIQFQKGLPKVKANSEKLEHILRNLISNAITFNRKGGRITIKAAEKKGFVETCVTDTGVGIAKKHIDRIFDRMYQIDASSTRDYGGTGLGLAIVKEMIETQGGRVKVKSTHRKGSTFCFTLHVHKGK